MPHKKDPPPVEESMAAMVDTITKLVSTCIINTGKILHAQTSSQHQLDIIMKQLTTQYEQNSVLLSTLIKTEDKPNPPKPEFGSSSNKKPHPNSTTKNQPFHIWRFEPPWLDWLFQADQYFSFYHIKSPERLAMVAFHLTSDPLSWYKYLFTNNLLTTWDSFTRALEVRFGPSSYDNHQEALFKLCQTTIVTAYQTGFQRLSNYVTHFVNVLSGPSVVTSNKSSPSNTRQPSLTPSVLLNLSKINSMTNVFALVLQHPLVYPTYQTLLHQHHHQQQPPPHKLQASFLPNHNTTNPSLHRTLSRCPPETQISKSLFSLPWKIPPGLQWRLSTSRGPPHQSHGSGDLPKQREQSTGRQSGSPLLILIPNNWYCQPPLFLGFRCYETTTSLIQHSNWPHLGGACEINPWRYHQIYASRWVSLFP